METFLFTCLGIVFGGIITFIVSKFYYKKSVKNKSISAYVQFISEILSDIDPEVKKKLHVAYNTQEVDNLYQMQFIIANTGEIAIRDIIHPLTIEIPNKGIVLDSNIIHIEPLGREVNCEIFVGDSQINFVKFNFPLLNSGEYFVAKLLIKGEIPRPNQIRKRRKGPLSEDEQKAIADFNIYDYYKFKLTVDDIPPEIETCQLPYNYLTTNYSIGPDFSTIIGGLIVLALDFCIGYFLFSLKEIAPTLFLFRFKTFFSNFSFLSFSIIISWLFVILLLILGIALIFSDLDSFKRRNKPKFKLPKKLVDQKFINRIGTYHNININ